MFGFLDPVLPIAEGLLTVLSDWMAVALGENATAVAIVVITLAVRAALLPLTVRSLRARRARAAIVPEEQELRRQCAADPGRLRRELAELHRRRGVSPWAGITPMLAQAPFFLVLYRLFSSPTIVDHTNLVFTHTLFGLPLGSGFTEAVATGYLPLYLGLFLLIGLAAWWSSRIAARAQQPTAGGPPADPQMTAATSRLARVLPFGVIVAAGVLPLAVGIYLTVTAWWAAVERHVGARPQAA